MGKELRRFYSRLHRENLGLGKPVIGTSSSETGCDTDDLREAKRLIWVYCVEKLGSHAERQGMIGNSTVQNSPYAAIVGQLECWHR